MTHMTARIVFLFLLFFSNTQLLAVTLTEGTQIPVRLTENVNANMSGEGETIYFQVLEDIYVDESLVIAEGTFVKGKIMQAVGRKSLGRGGKLTITAKSLKTAHNKTVRFAEEPLGSEGRKRTGATVAHVVVWGPIGLFAKGRAAYILADTEYDIEIDEDIELQPIDEVVDTRENLTEESSVDEINMNFAEYKSKINFRKGKIGKDFTVYISEAESLSPELNSRDVQITHMREHLLPKPIKASQLAWNKKKNRWEASFSYKNIVKYAVPGDTSVHLVILSDKKPIAFGESTLTTSWKMK